ncbi:MAG: hypothetical protein JRF63_03010 [Deltaproteobacteria bacterium]|nr:hypothetical protein [Deltaproteobacteria bacterium]
MSNNQETRDSVEPAAARFRSEIDQPVRRRLRRLVEDDHEFDDDEQHGLSLVVRGLKQQLRQLIQNNQGLEDALTRARRQVAEERRQREAIASRNEQLELSHTDQDNLETEVARLRRERDSLAGQVIDLEQDLASSRERVDEVGELLDRFSMERDDASEEAACLDSQFARAIAVIGELRAALAASQKREDSLSTRLRRVEHQMDQITDERDSFELDLHESRSSLESVRQSLLAVSGEWRSLIDR